ncbi:glutamine synthetase III [Lentisphaerota bacterium WC36G]|nr:glutamine synthetase III [Lentisphaerae bacterium WC36]
MTDNPYVAPSCEGKDGDINSIYGKDVFNLKTMREYLPRDTFKALMKTINAGSILDANIADSVANAMKRWALERGVSHYTHWFQPLTGSTAEKHDSFIEPNSEGGVIMNFSGSNLIKGEPDASSFPSGGLRATFEARGYTAWDPTSPAFIKRNDNGATLCIPTAFCSYTGEALDKKTPLLRSLQAVSKQAERILNCFGIEVDGKVNPTLGAEQEYFLIDRKLYMSRPDLVQTGRTLFGTTPAKHQQMEDHYFGAIKRRILNYMSDVDRALWALGIPAKTRHNEVAPAQFELAPLYAELNLAVDQNMMIMEVLRNTAENHGLVCLMHEKPFAGVNGSGKHNNWSIGANGMNMLEPGDDPKSNAVFVTTLCAIIQAVDKHADLLRIAAASAGNDHRLGANEAPPAIISIFLGDELNDVIEEIETGVPSNANHKSAMHVGVDALPVFRKDTTDRNRTSPFAFTGNKFEFRAVGSNQSCAGANVILNTIVAEAMDEIATELEKADADNFNTKLEEVLRNVIKNHKRVIFNGDNYADAWTVEAERRGLLNLRTTPEALEYFRSADNKAMFAKYGVFTDKEIESRYEILTEEYEKIIDIEGKVAANIAKTVILPVAVKYQTKLANSALKVKELGIDPTAQTELLSNVTALTNSLNDAINTLNAAVEEAKCYKTIIDYTNNVRKYADELEDIVDDNLWPLAKYSELLFIY